MVKSITTNYKFWFSIFYFSIFGAILMIGSVIPLTNYIVFLGLACLIVGFRLYDAAMENVLIDNMQK